MANKPMPGLTTQPTFMYQVFDNKYEDLLNLNWCSHYKYDFGMCIGMLKWYIVSQNL